jgi:hypothetical protein
MHWKVVKISPVLSLYAAKNQEKNNRLKLRTEVNSKYGAIPCPGATKVAVESLAAQINSKCKLATLRREKRKIRYENEI